MNQTSVSWLVAFGIVAVCTIVGNASFLAVYFKSDKLRRMRTSVLLVSLAAADLIVGAVAIPMCMALLRPGVADSNTFLTWYLMTDALSGFASLFGLAVIALERVYSVFWPHKHRALTKSAYYLGLVVIWLLAALQVVFILLHRSGFITPAALMCWFLPCMTVIAAVIVLSYCAVWVKLTRSGRRSPQAEHKLAQTLALVTGTFLVTWLPFFVMNGVVFLCVSCIAPHPNLVLVAKLFHYCNSFANPVVYSFRFPVVRGILAKIFCRRERTPPQALRAASHRQKASARQIGAGHRLSKV